MLVLTARIATNFLIEKADRTRVAFDMAMSLTAEFDVRRRAAFERNVREGFREGVDCEDEMFLSFEEADRLVGTTMPILSSTMLTVMASDPVLVSNIRWDLDRIAALSRTSLTVADVSSVPSVDGWLPDEIDIVVQAARGRAKKLLHNLRDAHTHCKRVLTARAPAVYPIQSGLLPRAKEPTVLGREALGTHFGDKGLELHDRLQDIMAACAPGAGEPDTLNYFGSHVTNLIRLGQSEAWSAAQAQMADRNLGLGSAAA